MPRKCDHVGAAFYTSTDDKTKVCYRCGKDVEIPPDDHLAKSSPVPVGAGDITVSNDDGLMRPNPGADIAGKVGREHPETSKKAAGRILPASGTQRSRVLVKLQTVAPEGRTDEELQAALDMNPSSQRPRRVELVEQGWIEDSGDRRKTVSGTDAIVWRYIPLWR